MARSLICCLIFHLFDKRTKTPRYFLHDRDWKRDVNQAGLPEEVRAAAEIAVPAGQCVFTRGQRADNFLVVTQGSVGVFARSGEGREVLLYRVRAGETCTLTTSCMLTNTRYPAEAVTETDVHAKIIGAEQFERALHESTTFRQFVFSSFSARLADMMQRMEQLLLDSAQLRLVRSLLRRAGAESTVAATHEQLAQEIGTAREVVSRLLKRLEQEKLISIKGDDIELLQPGVLRAIS